MRLQGKTAVITGASKGIGRAIATTFARQGAKLVLGDMSVEEGETLAGEMRQHGGSAHFVATDVGQRADNERLLERCLREYGRLDIFVGNAGINLPKLITESSDEEIDRLLNVNLKGLIYASRVAIPIMLQQGGGTILFTASKTGLVAQTDSPVYCASKGAVVMLAKALALDYAKQNIRVNALCPGIVDTPMLHEFANAMPDPEAAWQAYSAAQPIGRLATPQECADAALWLVSDEATFITGVALPVDGGFTAM
jgi:NAD(P)-dependent dehydrogenase (short-subunit alcohol dehydrogenase family)